MPAPIFIRKEKYMWDINDPSVYDDNYTVLSKIRKLIARITRLEQKPDYTLPTATSSRLGGIKVGENLTVKEDGTLNAQAGGGGGYTLPPATTSTLGGIIVGDNLSIDEDGRLSGQAGGGSSVTPSSSNPLMDGTASAGSSTEYSRGDHVHPSQIVELTQTQYDALVLAGTVDPNITYYISDAGSAGYIQQINATASVGSGTGTPTVQVTKSGTDMNPSFTFAFNNLKGEDGQDGTDGTDGVGLIDYSTSEQNTGLKWLNGKPIYQRSYAFIVPSYTSGGMLWEVISNSIIADIDKAIYMEAWHEDSNNILYNFENVYSGGGTTNGGGAIYYNKSTGITIGNSQASHNGRTGYVTIRYTKTTDQATRNQKSGESEATMIPLKEGDKYYG